MLGVLLHEAAHSLAWNRGIRDTSRAHQYHNKRYKELAEELGLTIRRHSTCGWSISTVSEETVNRYQDEIAVLATAITAHRRLEPSVIRPGDQHIPAGEDSGIRDRNGRPLICGCSPARRIRAHKTTIAGGPILCGVCRKPFTSPDHD
ncbi:hypothetical protein ACQP1G_34165 [Nocardia sp. CA-107356]|uniref:hypothetical protein n=1 Tax=Nocardia sp. CA-107356 TaxID=3239972 RepID=UPI003D8F0024